MFEPLVRTVEVACDQERAFDVFVHGMDRWWPTDRFSVSAFGGAPSNEIKVDARVGGTIVEVTPDGSDHLWGVFTSFDPHDYLRMDFHIPHPAEVDPQRSVVEVRFEEVGPRRTKVELVQSRWEAFGDRASMLYGGYGGGWTVIFEQAYREACEAE